MPNQYEPWSQESLDKLVKLYREGVKLEELADHLGKSYCCVKAMLSSLRKKGVNLPYRDRKTYASKKRKDKNRSGPVETAFDKLYHGPVPCGHWMITKPWGLRGND